MAAGKYTDTNNHSAEVTFLDGRVQILPIWKQNTYWVVRHPIKKTAHVLKFVEEYEGMKCYDEVMEMFKAVWDSTKPSSLRKANK